jgi:hypothetical protein
MMLSNLLYTIHFLAYSCKAFFSTFECVKKADTYISKKSRKIIKYYLIYSKTLFSKKSLLALTSQTFVNSHYVGSLHVSIYKTTT